MRARLPSRALAALLAAPFAVLGSGCAEVHTGPQAMPSVVARSYTPSRGSPARGASSPAVSASVVAYAAAQIGRPYCWGGVGPSCFDCSGLAQRAWMQAGVRLPRSADDVARKLPSVPLTEVRPGDLLWWPGHVAIYAGDGWSVEALNAQSGVVMRRAPRPRLALRPIL